MRRNLAAGLLILALTIGGAWMSVHGQSSMSGGGGGAASFPTLTGGTNTTAALVCGAGCSIATTSTGTIQPGLPDGSSGAPGLFWSGQPALGVYRRAADTWSFMFSGPNNSMEIAGVTGVANLRLGATGVYGWTNTAGNAALGFDTGISRISAKVVGVGTGSQGDLTGSLQAAAYLTGTNCAVNSASPAACGSAAAGVFAIPASQTTYTVNTTAVTANSRIMIDAVTDNTGIPSSPTCVTPVFSVTDTTISSRVAATSFTLALASNAGITCYNYWIVN